MANFSALQIALIFLFTLLSPSLASRELGESTQSDSTSMAFEYHKGPPLSGRFTVNLVWYGSFKPAQKAIVADFFSSLTSSPRSQSQPSVATWWGSVGKYYRLASPRRPSSLSISLGHQISDPTCSLGKSLKLAQIQALASKNGAAQANALTVVLTASDVAVEGFCMSRCGTHGLARKSPYIWVGNSEEQCPGQCAWPFHQPIYGPQGPPLVAPNGDVGLDGMVINLAGLLAGTATNPFGNGFYQGPKEAPLEAATACPGVYGKGAYPGYAGQLLVDPKSGASYNANGVNGRKYLLPALYDPSTSACSTIV